MRAEEENRIQRLLLKNQSIFSGLKQKAQYINQTDQILTHNLKNILSPLDNKPSVVSPRSVASRKEHPLVDNHHLSNLQTALPNSLAGVGDTTHILNQSAIQPKYQVEEERSQFYRDPEISFSHPVLPGQTGSLKKDVTTSYSVVPGYQESLATQPRIVRSCLFVPLNKLYRSPIIQLKSKDKLILARKYKGAPIPNSGKITDGKTYRFPQIFTQEEQLFMELMQHKCQNTLNGTPAEFEKESSNIIMIVGSQDTLKKKLHMCLLLRNLQLLKAKSQFTKVVKIDIHYSESWDKTLPIQQEENIYFDEETRKVGFERLTMAFERLLEIVSKPKDKSLVRKGLPRFITRISRIIFASQSCRTQFQVVSTNNQNLNYIREVAPDRVVWCINPLVKNYQATQNTLEIASSFVKLTGSC